jgi:hypothetical protein
VIPKDILGMVRSRGGRGGRGAAYDGWSVGAVLRHQQEKNKYLFHIFVNLEWKDNFVWTMLRVCDAPCIGKYVVSIFFAIGNFFRLN